MANISEGYNNVISPETIVWSKGKKGYTHFKDNDVVFAKIIPCFQNLKSTVLHNLENGYGCGTTEFHVLRANPYIVTSDYLLWFVKNPRFIADGLSTLKGTVGQQRISTPFVENYLIPIPPINEQKRIVSKIEELFSIVTEHENIVDTTNKLVMQLRVSILNYAIQGKLVPQDPNDRPVNIDCKNPIIRRDNSYYEIINGKEVCIDDEIPFEIPESWQWVHGRDCMKKMENTSPSGDSFDYIDIDSVDNKIHSIRTSKKISVRNAPSRAKRKLHSGDTIFSMVRPYLENIAFVTEQYANSIASTGFYVCRPSKYLSPQYLYYLMLSRYVIDGLNSHMKGDNSPSINSDVIVDFLYPIPPMNEQERIASKIENLLNSLKSLQ